jgi:hypothetical protein
MTSRRPLVASGGLTEQVQAGDSLGVRSSVNGTTSSPTSTNAAFVVIPEMTTTVTTIGGDLLCIFDSGFNLLSPNDSFNFALFLDGVEVTGTRRQVTLSVSVTLGLINTDNQQPSGCHAFITGVSAGAHTLTARWAVLAGTARANLTQRKLTLVELF